MPSLHDLTNESGFVFEATVEQLGASTASSFPATDETAVVRVTRILKSTSALAGYTGHRITLHLQAPVSVKVGDEAVFFTHGLHYGESLVVAELGNFVGNASAVEADLSSAVQASQDAEITKRLAQAELVVTGVASAPVRYGGALAHAMPIRKVSEHDPDWHVATVMVESVEKGTHAPKTADVMFANSMDVAWYRAPKIKAGDRGVFLLHNSDVYGRSVPASAITHPLDFRPLVEVDRIRTLIK
jgi:hypothetical protein